MKKLLTLVFVLTSISAYSQIGASVNTEMESTIDYKINRFRLGATFDPDVDKWAMVMPSVKYEIIQKEDYTFHAGITLVDLDHVSGVRIPVGIDAFPFANKNFGFVMEVYGTYGTEYEWDLPDGYDDRFFIRGTVGFTYRFGKE
ncbi:hypothetical protein [Marinilabilia rubra]|uniref:Outer membrane protein beta-barrel domain-containing protein n=1 Tax=Marinilabilia rubra TaxID=2162893 RepID=A0A2U2B4A2_9BACT|nr:hypothetical protein [Marinilabilia rubra]PWD97888.1 hypothetical protein DDZ16_18180 [Marinilabilia rubra]